jgi:hypothetical protein
MAWSPRSRLVTVSLLVVVAPSCASSGAPAPTAASSDANATTGPASAAVPNGSASAALHLPKAIHGAVFPLSRVPVIAVAGHDVTLDGETVADLAPILSSGHMLKLDAEFSALRTRRDAWKSAHPGEPLPGLVVFRFDARLPVAAVKSVIQTAAFAAYPSGYLAVVDPKGEERLLPVDAIVPDLRPQAAAEAAQETVLQVDVDPRNVTLTWTRGALSCHRGEPLSTPVELPRERSDVAAAVGTAWNASGAHRAPADERLDHAIIHADDNVDYERLVSVVDAIAATKRPASSSNTAETVPAFLVSLAVK